MSHSWVSVCTPRPPPAQDSPPCPLVSLAIPEDGQPSEGLELFYQIFTREVGLTFDQLLLIQA
ncbi:hypothetical protein GCM10017771_07910 [Streptomyces capitiformicae]|uniref:Uncharacterized protein n=1 Tax=Streptomyces capitiformicae TaxID=2014920 RepID=A0A919L443_9ACTN|nr:hypothetical protein GCM10017771_07910 [Streptomyces capitiformicae]